MDYVNILIPFVGGLGMFIYGMQIMAQGLENAAGNRMKSLLEALTKNKFLGVLLGAFITAVIQSSSATTVMVVGFVNASIMNLSQAMGVIMGANIGTTVTGWLVSSAEWAKFLKPDNLAPIAIIIGVIVMMTGKRRSSKDIASIIIGFGLLFIGISVMSDSVSPLQDSEGFRNIFVALSGNPLLGIAAGAIVTAVIQSSSASVGILQSLAAAGLVPFGAAIYIIMGQNIGTCVTAMLSGMGAKKNAKVAARMHLLFNIIGTVIFSVIAVILLSVVFPDFATGMISQTQISTVHTLFNIGTTLLLFPVSDWIIKLAKKISHVEDVEVDESKVQLDERMLETPGIALQSTISECVRMGEIVKICMERSKEVLFRMDYNDIMCIKEEEDKVDRLCAGLTSYAIKITSLSVSEKEHKEAASLLQVASDMERISDYCENIAEFTENLIEHKVTFTEIGRKHLRSMMDVCAKSYEYALEAYRNQDKELALKVIEEETKADNLEVTLRAEHIERLASNQCQTEAGIVFLDTLVCLERISDHARNIAEEVLNHIA